MMGNLKKNGVILFAESMELYAETGKELDGNRVHIFNGDIYLGPIKLYSGSNSITDNVVLIWCSNIVFLFIFSVYGEC